MMEMVQGEGGVVALDADYVQSVADYCHAHDILIIVDEVQTGVGRTGTFLACEQFGLKPDLVTLARAGRWPAHRCRAGKQKGCRYHGPQLSRFHLWRQPGRLCRWLRCAGCHG